MIIDSLLAKLAPYECVGCSLEGQLLCGNCRQKLELVPERCYRCRRITEDHKTCPACRAQSLLYRVTPFAIYKDAARALVWQLKFNGAQAAATEMAKLMAPALHATPGTVIVPVPTATSRTRRRGYDQAVLLARAIARETRLPYLPCLRRLGQDEQLGATRSQRITQLRRAYRCVKTEHVSGKNILLIDDVLTTGATLEAAAKALKSAGAARVSALTFAQA